MVDAATVLQVLAEQGTWVHAPLPDAELLRVEIRRAARRRGIRVRTGINSAGYVWATTPDGLPAEEPWRGAAAHAYESGAMDELLVDAVNRIARGEDPSARQTKP